MLKDEELKEAIYKIKKTWLPQHCCIEPFIVNIDKKNLSEEDEIILNTLSTVLERPVIFCEELSKEEKKLRIKKQDKNFYI